MKSKLFIGAAAVLSAGAIAWAAKDPIVMKVNGEDVPKSEFEYLYHKNSQQQIEAQPLEEYIGMFELYKMKVADAKAEGLDTTETFLNEMKQYRLDLAKPYIADSLYLNSLVDEAYQHSLEEADYYHIMLAKGRTAQEEADVLILADSIRNALVEGADFEQLARRYSVDRSVVNNGGHLGYGASGRYPYRFEHAAFQLTPGQISDIVESSAGYHILKGGVKRPSKGSVQAEHIMKMVRPGSSPEQEALAKAQIDSLYEIVVANPALFESVARDNSDDTNSARRGGQLGWFVTGQMVPEFSEAAFSLGIDEISRPVKTAYGWHIIKKTGEKGVKSREELKGELLNQFNDPRDERFKMIRANRDRNLEKKHKGQLNTAFINEMRQAVIENGLDSAFYAAYTSSPAEIFSINKVPVSAAEFVATFNGMKNQDSYVSGIIFDDRLEVAYDNALLEAEEDWLYKQNEDYRNLLNEYRDGSLLYEVSLRKVWDKAAQDTQGLDNYFKAHKGEYKFKEPRAKGLLVQAKNDSIADLIKARYNELPKESALQTLRDEFKQEALIDRLLAPKGLNKYVDYLVFDGEQPEGNAKYPVYFILDRRVVTEPEEMADVKGAVTADYQQELEQNWTTELRRKYPVIRYDKELKKIK